MAIALEQQGKPADFSGLRWPFQTGINLSVLSFLRERFFTTHPITDLHTYMSALENVVSSIEPYSLAEGLPRLIQCHRDVIRFGSRSDIPITPFITAIADQEQQMHRAVDIAGQIILHEGIIGEMSKELEYEQPCIVKRSQVVFGHSTYSEAAHKYARANVYTHCDMVRRVHSRRYEAPSLEMKKAISALLADPLYRSEHDEVDAFFDAFALYNQGDFTFPID